ncbi:hypothetical protein HVTV-2_gp47 [Haloarcula virus HVTV-2]|uniref:Uncharacterized protein n=1 Tax=Haloarcula vallismortis tailed virus 1 TaxID=1262528 RepID=L7TNI7_9CAUD|nr:hypothetical protein HVTV1_47 [Haloarcula vallismortis tailed virus 1]AGC34417.1 hypothetical protein HVTV1_47 [Haloarcula vallismortis tailed virus 1]UBF22854.1 hypothetical protein HVTV-2_gp47 [Haloarcula virus HVTV-2]
MVSEPVLLLAIVLGTLMFFAFMRIIFCLAEALTNIALHLMLRWSE